MSLPPLTSSQVHPQRLVPPGCARLRRGGAQRHVWPPLFAWPCLFCRFRNAISKEGETEPAKRRRGNGGVHGGEACRFILSPHNAPLTHAGVRGNSADRCLVMPAVQQVNSSDLASIIERERLRPFTALIPRRALAPPASPLSLSPPLPASCPAV